VCNDGEKHLNLEKLSMRIGFKDYAEVTQAKNETFEAVQILQKQKVFGKNSDFCAFGSRVNCLTVERLQISAIEKVLSISFIIRSASASNHVVVATRRLKLKLKQATSRCRKSASCIHRYVQSVCLLA
jgi:hypothetical protein